jgi:hypothetical protein
MPNISVIQPIEMGTNFSFDTVEKKWKIDNSTNISQEGDNILNLDESNKLKVSSSNIKHYQLVQDNIARKIYLYQYSANESFDVSTAQLINEVDMLPLDAQVDDVAISSGVLTFTDTQTGTQLVFDTDSPIYQILHSNTTAINISGDGKNSALSIDLIVDTSTDNLLKITANGAVVDKNDILALLNSSGSGSAPTIVFSHDPTGQNLKISIDGAEQAIATSKLVNTSGDVLGYVISP